MKRATFVCVTSLFVVISFTAVDPACAQSNAFETLIQKHPDALQAVVGMGGASVYKHPRTSSFTKGRVDGGGELVVYAEENDFYAVAHPERGSIGYVQKKYVELKGAYRSQASSRTSARAEQQSPRNQERVRKEPARTSSSQRRQSEATAPAGPGDIDRAAGGWTLVVASKTQRRPAHALAEKYRASGQRAGVLAARIDGTLYYRVGVGQFETRAGVKGLQSRLRGAVPDEAWPMEIDPEGPEIEREQVSAAQSSRQRASQRWSSAGGTASRGRSQTQATAQGASDIDRAAGGWTLVVASKTQRRPAHALAGEYRSSGQQAGVLAARIDGALYYRVGIGQFDTRAGAKGLKARLEGAIPGGAWPMQIDPEGPEIEREQRVASARTPERENDTRNRLEDQRKRERQPSREQQRQAEEERRLAEEKARRERARPEREQIGPVQERGENERQQAEPEEEQRRIGQEQKQAVVTADEGGSKRYTGQLKSPSKAMLLSAAVPGGGQFYAGKGGKGGLLLAMSVGVPLAGYVMSPTRVTIDCRAEGADKETCKTEETDFTPFYVGVGLGAVSWLAGVLSARRDVREHNEVLSARAEVNGAEVRVAPTIGRAGSASGYGLRLSMRF